MTGTPPLRIATAVEDGDVRLALDGELTYTTAPRFTAAVADVLGPSGPRLVLDVGRLLFCDSVGLSALVDAQRRVGLLGGEVVLRGVHGSLARNLAVTGAAVLFTTVPADDADDDDAGAPVVSGSGRAGGGSGQAARS